MRVLRDHKHALGWSLADLKGIRPSMCMHRILLEDGHKPSVEAQRRLNPTMKEVVRKKGSKMARYWGDLPHFRQCMGKPSSGSAEEGRNNCHQD